MRRLLWLALLCVPAPGQDGDLVARLLEMEAPARDWKTDPIAHAYAPGPPPPGADLDTVLDYWGRRETAPPVEVRERVLAACRAEPRRIPSLCDLLPVTEEARACVRRWREEPTARTVAPWLLGRVDEWLYADERPDEDWAEDLDYLAAQDLPRALALARRLEENDDPEIAARATGLLLRHEPEGPGRDRRIGRLRTLAADAGALGVERNAALRSLAGVRWEGRDRWLVPLFADPDVDLAPVVAGDPEALVPFAVSLVGHEHRIVHDQAVHCLIQFQLDAARPDALRPLLPWLSDPDWATDLDRDRLRLVQSLTRVDLPECAPGLLHLLAHEEDGTILEYAYQAVAHYRPEGAAPLLRPRFRDGAREGCFLRAAVACGAIRPDEMVAGVLALARAKAEGRVDEGWWGPADPTPDEALGRYLVFQPPESEEVAARLLAEAGRVPGVAAIVHAWPGRVPDVDLVRRLGQESLPAEDVRVAMERRAQVADHAGDELRRLLAERRGATQGIAAALLAEPDRVLDGEDRAAQRALLACARLVRLPLPCAKVARLLPDDAAEKYLRALDTPEARACLPGRVVGWDVREDPRREWFRGPAPPREVYSLSSWGDGESGRVAVLLFADRAELRWSDNPVRWRTRPLAPAEAEGLRAFLAAHRVDDLAPLPHLADDGIQYAYDHLTPDGGVHLFLDNPDCAEGAPLYDVVTRRFQRLTDTGTFTTRYAVQDKVPDVALLAEGGVEQVWAHGDDVRILRDDWTTLDGTEAPLPDFACDLVRGQAASGSFSVDLGGGATLSWSGQELWATRPGRPRARLVEGRCGWPLFTPGQKWLVLAVAEQGEWSRPNAIVRIDLATLEVHRVDLEPPGTDNPVVWLPAHKRVLLVDRAAEVAPRAFLLDPDTGICTEVAGDVGPLRWLDHPLQPTGQPHEYWVAKQDMSGTGVGRYDTAAFSFTPVRHYPGLEFWSRSMWVDGGHVYVAYAGDLLRLPLGGR